MESFAPQTTSEDLPPVITAPRNYEECRASLTPAGEVLAQIGSKWTMFIIVALGQGPMRFSELRRHIAGISQKVLTATLRDLEKDGFVSRKVTPTIPPRRRLRADRDGQGAARAAVPPHPLGRCQQRPHRAGPRALCCA